MVKRYHKDDDKHGIKYLTIDYRMYTATTIALVFSFCIYLYRTITIIVSGKISIERPFEIIVSIIIYSIIIYINLISSIKNMKNAKEKLDVAIIKSVIES